jgi:hypothetical protein
VKQQRKPIATKVVLSLVAGLLTSLPFVNTAAQAETCPQYNLQSLFFEEYYGEIKWDNSNAPRTLTWNVDAQVVGGIQVTRFFSAQEIEWLKLSFNSYDEVLDTIDFQYINDASNADIQVGVVPNRGNGALDNGYWKVQEVGNFRASGSIQFVATSPFLESKNGFIETVQSEIGNLLGLGDIRESVDVDSVLKDPDTAPFGSLPLSDYDIDLMRQFYGESTCHSAWPKTLITKKEAIAKEIADAKSQAEAEAKAAAEAEVANALNQAAVDSQAALEAKLRAEMAAEKKAMSKKTTIACVKGKTTKKVSGANPKCPAGYKKR